MSILIKGMEMPHECAKCEFVDYYKGLWYCHAINDLVETGQPYKDERCPLVDIPTPHGRLIDADALIERFAPNQAYFRYAICEVVESLPTIIDAEEGEHGEKGR